jgi:hypothetical protein
VTPNRCLTLVGLPCVRDLDHDAFELRSRMVRLPAPAGPAPLVSTHTRLRHPQPAPKPAVGPLQELAVSAAVVFMLGCAIVGWLL